MRDTELDRLEQELGGLLSTVREMERQVLRLSRQLTELREEKTSSLEMDVIRRGVAKIPFSDHPLREKSAAFCNLYLTALLRMAPYVEGDKTPFFIFCQWLRDQVGLKKRLRTLLLESQQTGTEFFAKLKASLQGDMADLFLLDLLMSASTCGPLSENGLCFVGEMAGLLEIDEMRMKTVAAAARSAMRGKGGKKETQHLSRTCAIYLPESIRRVVVAVNGMAGNLRSQRWVEQGEILVVFPSGKTVNAPCSGRLFSFTEGGVQYGVLGLPSDNKDAVRAWVRAQKGGKA